MLSWDTLFLWVCEHLLFSQSLVGDIGGPGKSLMLCKSLSTVSSMPGAMVSSWGDEGRQVHAQ